jgi:hypothetical protein
MKPKRRGRPKSQNQKSQFNIRLPEVQGDCLSNNDRYGLMWYIMKKVYPSGWSIIDPTASESPKKKFHDDYSQKSKRSSWGWTNSNIMAFLIDDYVRFTIRQHPEIILDYREDVSDAQLPKKYEYLAFEQYKELNPDENYVNDDTCKDCKRVFCICEVKE